jgi:hypothetical protein
MWFSPDEWDPADGGFADTSTTLTATSTPLAINVTAAGGRINTLSREHARAVISIEAFLDIYETYIYAWNGATARAPASQILTVKLAPRAVIAQDVPITVTNGKITWPTIPAGQIEGITRATPYNYRMTVPTADDNKWGRNVRFNADTTMAALAAGSATRARIPNTARAARTVDGVTPYTGLAASGMTTFRIPNTKTEGNNPRDIPATGGQINALPYEGLLVLRAATAALATQTVDLNAATRNATAITFPLNGLRDGDNISDVGTVVVTYAAGTTTISDITGLFDENVTTTDGVVTVTLTNFANTITHTAITATVKLAKSGTKAGDYPSSLNNGRENLSQTATINFTP